MSPKPSRSTGIANGTDVTLLEHGVFAFLSDSRLLEELGERLVASAEVAVVELIKNAYDADAVTCELQVDEKSKSITIIDDGHGMTRDEFEARWMRIATAGKMADRASRRFKRRLTGQKGIGRFAVRYLGSELSLSTTAHDPKTGKMTRLYAHFDWNKIDQSRNLAQVEVPFEVYSAPPNAKTGTILKITRLAQALDFVTDRSFRTKVLTIVSPLSGLDRGHMAAQKPAKSEADPGFQALLPGVGPTDAEQDLASLILGHARATVRVKLVREKLSITTSFEDGVPVVVELDFPNSIAAGLYADLRFFPKRKGMLQAKEVEGRDGWKWIKANHGIAVVDHGFRVFPYGFEGNDWLSLAEDHAHNRRDWRSQLARTLLPFDRRVASDPALNPALNIPTNHQMIGAVFVESSPSTVSKAQHDLTPSMDREGFLQNAAMANLIEAIRFALENLASLDKARLLDEKHEQAEEKTEKARKDVRKVLDWIKKRPTLSQAEKDELVTKVTGIQDDIEKAETYDRQSRQKLEAMSSLGVVAGFLTHEARRMSSSLEQALRIVRELAKTHPELNAPAAELADSFESFSSIMSYTTSFVDATHTFRSVSFAAAPQIRRVVDRLASFARSREIATTIDLGDDVMVPQMPVVIYSGIVMNLYTNAMKAILATENSTGRREIVFRGQSNSKAHTLDVLDTGIGIEPQNRARIWDPMYSTTTRVSGPLGTGMGLGLSLVRQMVLEIGGSIELRDAPAGFSTWLELTVPFGGKSK